MGHVFKVLDYPTEQALLRKILADNIATAGLWSDSNIDLLYTQAEQEGLLGQLAQAVGYSSLDELLSDLNDEESTFNVDTGEFVMWLETKSQGHLAIYYHEKSLLVPVLIVGGLLGVSAFVYVKTR